MALQMGLLSSILFFIGFKWISQVGADVNIVYYPVIEQHAPQVNKNSNDQEHGTTACSPWKYHKYNDSSCVCGPSIHKIVDCEDTQSTVYLLSCHCMSYKDDGNNDTAVVMGACPYLCTNHFYTTIYADTNLSSLCNSDVRQNRQGQMCGKCKDNHSPSPYSYQLKCAHCSNYKYNWLKYLLMAYLPLTIFFLVVIFFRFSALSASMNAFIFYSQIVSSPTTMSLVSTFAYFSENHPVVCDINLITSVKVTATILGMWNLDFFRMLYDPYCLQPHSSIIQVLCLDYAVAMYPLLLIFVTYVLIKLFGRFEVVRFFCKPVVWLSTRLDYQWNASNSLIEAFATFILLSYVKVINTSFDILMPVQLHNVSGDVVGLYAYYNGSMEYFGHDHLPYAVLAIFMLITFNLVPFLLLCLYPCRCFQSFLNCCRLNSQVLRTFMDAFQGCYKFEPYDCRYWAAFYLFLRIALLAAFEVTQSGYIVVVGGILLIPALVTAAIVRPYREMKYNVIDVVFLSVFVQIFFSATLIALSTFNERFEGISEFMLGVGLIFPIAYITVLSVYKILPKAWIGYIKERAMHLLSYQNRILHRGDEQSLLLRQENIMQQPIY